MPVQTSVSTLAQKLGAQIAKAHEQHKDKAVDNGFVQLPGGIKSSEGVAQLNSAYISQYKDGDRKGQDFFRASGICKKPESVNGVRCKGIPTSVMIPLCDDPASWSADKRKTFLDYWEQYRNWFLQFGVDPPEVRIGKETDQQAGLRIHNYYVAAAKVLCDQKPYFSFSTNDYTPPKTKANPMPKTRTYEKWHGVLPDYVETISPTDGVTEEPAASNAADMQPEPFTEPEQTTTEAVPTTIDEPAEGMPELSDVVAAYVQAAMTDPKGETQDGSEAIQYLTDAAIAEGATEEQINLSDSWADVGQWILEGVPPFESADEPTAPKVGDKITYTMRTAKGEPMANPTTKKVFAPVEIIITAVDEANKTVVGNTAKDGKPHIDNKKNPRVIKWEWFE